MSRGAPAGARYRHREKLTSRGVVPDLLSNLPGAPKRRSSAPTKKKVERHQEDGISFVNVESTTETGNVPTTEEILEKAQESDPNYVFEIDLRDRGLREVPNLKKFPKTRIVDLSSNKIERITYLFNIKDLRELKLYDNVIRILEGLDDLKELSILQLQHNQITAIGGALTALKKLKQLRLDCNRLRHITTKELCSCAQITCLDLSYNCLDNIDFVVCLPNLDELIVSHNNIKSLPALNRCKKLYELRLAHNAIGDASGLKGTASLRSLDLSHNHLLGLKPVGKLSNLEYFNVSGNHLEDLEYFPTCFPAVDVLNVASNRLANADASLAALALMENLCELTLAGNPFSDDLQPSTISAGLPRLEMLDGLAVRRAGISAKAVEGVPLMRPMSASTVISAKFVENQIAAMKEMLEPFETKTANCFANLRQSIEKLPREAPSSARPESSSSQDPELSRPSSRCCRRSRIQEAQEFAKSMNFEA